MSVDLGMKANIDFFLWPAKKSISNTLTKIFDPSNERFWPKFFKNTMILSKTLSSRVFIGCTNLSPSWATSKWKINNSHVQVWRSLCIIILPLLFDSIEDLSWVGPKWRIRPTILAFECFYFWKWITFIKHKKNLC